MHRPEVRVEYRDTPCIGPQAWVEYRDTPSGGGIRFLVCSPSKLGARRTPDTFLEVKCWPGALGSERAPALASFRFLVASVPVARMGGVVVLALVARR